MPQGQSAVPQAMPRWQLAASHPSKSGKEEDAKRNKNTGFNDTNLGCKRRNNLNGLLWFGWPIIYNFRNGDFPQQIAKLLEGSRG
jgi:hypothetical protein